VSGPGRHIELTIVVRPDITPWRYPPALDFQYGDWFRGAFERGDFAPWTSPNPDLAVLLTSFRTDGRPLVGPRPADVLPPIPRADLDRAMLDTVPDLLADLDDDTRNVLLTLARIWTTIVTGEIRPKDAAADWAIERLPEEHRSTLAYARAIYLGDSPERWDDLRPLVRHDAEVIVEEIRRSRSP
jgi:streptomycin 3"-adenylyltransferase